MKEVQIFTDGACSGNPGAGGYGAILRFGAHEKEISGGFAQTTNNRMELLAAIEALKLLKEPCKVTLYTDSQYLANGITKGWAKSWKARGWKKSNKEPALNPELWEELLRLCDIHRLGSQKRTGGQKPLYVFTRFSPGRSLAKKDFSKNWNISSDLLEIYTKKVYYQYCKSYRINMKRNDISFCFLNY